MRAKIIIIFITVTLLSTTSITYAHLPNIIVKNNKSTIVKRSLNNYEPENFNNSNNLVRKIGGLNKFAGQEIVIRGRLVDRNAIAIADAKIYIWQVGLDGKYHYKPLRQRVNKALIQQKASDFQGSGIFTTNNFGEFEFISIYPGSISHEMPHINIKAVHRDYGEIQTKIYLRPFNKLSEIISDSPIVIKNKHNFKIEAGYLIVDVTDEYIYDFVITTPFKNRFRRY